jgi:hypothetical protein
MLIGLLLLALALAFVSCEKKYWMTVRVCHESLFVENFRINPAGIYSNYLTDSVNFRIYIGIFDPEQNTYTYTCNGDSISVGKYTLGRESGYRTHEMLSRKVYSLRELRKEHRFDY